MINRVTTKLLLVIGASMLPCIAHAVPLVRSIGGSDPASIQATVDQFRADLGDLNPNVAGSFAGGRREINWDGVPDAFAAPNNLPPDFFNVNSPRGVVFTTPGTGFQVSANATVGAIEFGNINPNYPALFATFSPQRLFTSLDSNIVDVLFFEPGGLTRGLTNGFGAVFTDVDLANTTGIQYFDASNNLLFSDFVKPGTVGNESLSFLRVSFTEGAVVARVRITNGNSPLGPVVNEGANIDLVVMDDFIYGEPIAVRAVSEPWTLILVGLGLLGMGIPKRLRTL